ncbi:ABC transporter permease [Limnochorda pilosa]|uniref:ABC transporter permease n=1 Tax=Limnochorda pilosa TaxID=1555112 RepID=A0A0K2SN38_LIMPI|nr:ABC transporter permease [Limnochorda pilosa]BAS28530.1 ABC transporter permease [Limnochorda pilosa]
MSGTFALGVLEQGLVYGIMVLGVYLTFRVLNFPDLTVDGSFTLGGSIAAAMIVAGRPPLLATLVAALGGLAAGAATGVLHTRLRVSGLLAGILTMTALYSINLRVMGRSNVPLLRRETLVTQVRGLLDSPLAALLLFLAAALLLKLLLDWFLQTEYGLAVQATGDNPGMIRSLGADTDRTTLVGLALSNGLVALSGALVAQHQGFADVGMGIGMIVAGLASVILGQAIVRARGVFFGTLAALVGSILYRAAAGAALRVGFAPSDLKLVTALLVVVALAVPRTLEWAGEARRRPGRRLWGGEGYAGPRRPA